MFVCYKSQAADSELHSSYPEEGWVPPLWWKSCAWSVGRASAWGGMPSACISALPLVLFNFLKKPQTQGKWRGMACEWFGHAESIIWETQFAQCSIAQFTADLVITALKNFVRTQVWVVWSVLSWLCIRSRITMLTKANKSCFLVE